MTWARSMTKRLPTGAGIHATFTKRVFISAAAVLVCFPAMAQNPELQQKLAAVKAVAAENKQQLQQYQWTETIQLTLKETPRNRKAASASTDPAAKFRKLPSVVLRRSPAAAA